MRYMTPLLLIAMLTSLMGCDLEPKEATNTPTAPEVDQPVVEPVPAADPNQVTVVIETSKGNITAVLWPDKAPKTVENFLTYADDGFFDGTIFHRVMNGFMIQGGGFTPRLDKKQTYPTIRNEARSDVKNLRGTLAMARTPDPHSASAQFFINHKNNPGLDHVSPTQNGYGYCVFGEVIDGMDVVDAIARVQTMTVNGRDDVPVNPVMIISIRRID
jgi:peptidyl-prolyl cis-trans isomerase B (cyclophilin B)